MKHPQLSTLVKSRNFVVTIRLDTAGRKGKTVTLLDGLPKQEPFLKELLKILKASCGAGGSLLMDKKEGALEIQGDHRDRVVKILDEAEIKSIRK